MESLRLYLFVQRSCIFFDTLHEDKFNVLILDEPDVHLHPDLQYRLSRMILSIIGEYSEVKYNY